MKIGFPPNNQLGAALLWYINPGLVQRLTSIDYWITQQFPEKRHIIKQQITRN
jgi:hypothetical protein